MLNHEALAAAIEQAKELQVSIDKVNGAHDDALDAMKEVLNPNSEENLRATNPAVRDAWEKYEIVLRLARNAAEL